MVIFHHGDAVEDKGEEVRVWACFQFLVGLYVVRNYVINCMVGWKGLFNGGGSLLKEKLIPVTFYLCSQININTL